MKKFEMVNLLDEIPNIESFILPKSGDDLYSKLLYESNENHTIDVHNQSESETQNKRVKRWLKNEDRKLIQSIFELTSKKEIDKNLLKSSLQLNKEAGDAWNVIRSMLNTNRSIDFLQSRYYKLLSNQSLNTKEMSLLSDKYDAISVDKFMVIFPGKTKETLNTIIKSFKTRDALKATNLKQFNADRNSDTSQNI